MPNLRHLALFMNFSEGRINHVNRIEVESGKNEIITKYIPDACYHPKLFSMNVDVDVTPHYGFKFSISDILLKTPHLESLVVRTSSLISGPPSDITGQNRRSLLPPLKLLGFHACWGLEDDVLEDWRQSLNEPGGRDTCEVIRTGPRPPMNWGFSSQ